MYGQKSRREKSERSERRSVKTVVLDKTPNFIDVTAYAIQVGDLLRPTESRLRVFDIDIAFSSSLPLILNFLKTAMRAIRTCVCH